MNVADRTLGRLCTLLLAFALLAPLFLFTPATARAAADGISVAPGTSPGGYIPLDLFGGTTVLSLGDNDITDLDVPGFVYTDQAYTKLGIASNGFLVVGGGLTAADLLDVNQNLPDTAVPNNVLAPFWTDLNPANGGKVMVNALTDGVSTWIVVEWQAIPNATNAAQLNSFQVWLGTNGVQDVSFTYKYDQLGTGTDGLLTIGAENANGTSGQAIYYNGVGSLPSVTGDLRVTYTPIPDVTAPTITLATPTDGAQYTLNQVLNAAYACADEDSGVATCAGTVPNGSPIDTSSVGTKTFTVTATDNDGNSVAKTVSYQVIYAFSGFYAPVDNAPAINVATAGRTIPLKWRLTDASGAPMSNLSGVTVTSVAGGCSAGAPTDSVETYVSSPSGLQNLGDGYYQFNWKTEKSWSGSCRALKLDLGGGQVITAFFQFR